jgi:hypothetical protein
VCVCVCVCVCAVTHSVDMNAGSMELGKFVLTISRKMSYLQPHTHCTMKMIYK